jgi:hypothetical protein
VATVPAKQVDLARHSPDQYSTHLICTLNCRLVVTKVVNLTHARLIAMRKNRFTICSRKFGAGKEEKVPDYYGAILLPYQSKNASPPGKMIIDA